MAHTWLTALWRKGFILLSAVLIKNAIRHRDVCQLSTSWDRWILSGPPSCSHFGWGCSSFTPARKMAENGSSRAGRSFQRQLNYWGEPRQTTEGALQAGRWGSFCEPHRSYSFWNLNWLNSFFKRHTWFFKQVNSANNCHACFWPFEDQCFYLIGWKNWLIFVSL